MKAMAKKRGRTPMCTPERVKKICAAIENGETFERAAELGGIVKSTFYRWMDENKDFKDAVKRAKDVFLEWEMNGILSDAKKSLKALICGQEWEETKTEYEQDPHNPGQPRIKKQTTITRKALPNATAVIFALCNRDPDNWKNRISNELSGKIETEETANVSLDKIPDELLAKVLESLNGE